MKFLFFQANHKYMVQARILRKSWPTLETAWPQVGTLHRLEDPGASHKPGSGKKPQKSKDRRRTAGNVQVPSPVIQMVCSHQLRNRQLNKRQTKQQDKQYN